MKLLKFLTLNIILIFLLFQMVQMKKNSLRQPQVSLSSSSSSSIVTKEVVVKERPPINVVWNDLFLVSRTTSCMAEENRKALEEQIEEEEARKNSSDSSIEVNEKAFLWVKKWGFGPVSYLLDYLDPIFRDEVLQEFKDIHKAVMEQDSENTPEYKDPFDLAYRISVSTPERKTQLMKDLKIFEATYNPIVFQLSANAVQIMEALKKFRWFIDYTASDYAADFILKYDLNGDGRLNPRELILGSIMMNKHTLGSAQCTHCFSKIGRRISALFTYFDCGELGFINADQLWKGLPNLRRPTNQFNIFGYATNDNIRTNSVNDFVLKNQSTKDAYLEKDEFVSGLLLGIWDRQVSETAILDDDVRNLKSLRWIDNNTKDVIANNYALGVARIKYENEERARYEKFEREKEKEQEKALKAQARKEE